MKLVERHDTEDFGLVHLHGYRHAQFHDSPLSRRFHAAFETMPYIDVLSENGRTLLFRKDWFRRLVPIFARGANLTALLNAVIGMDILRQGGAEADAQRRGLVEEIAAEIMSDIESRRTLDTRIAKVEAEIAGKGRSFERIVSKRHYNDLERGIADVGLNGGEAVTLAGVLNKAASLVFDDINRKKYVQAGVAWIISDLPYFLMGQHYRPYNGSMVALRFPPGLLEAAQAAAPFDGRVDWYPYVRVTGTYSPHFQAKAPNIPTIEVTWFAIRRARSQADHLEEDIGAALRNDGWRKGAASPFYDRGDDNDVVFLLYLLYLTYKLESAEFQQFSKASSDIARDLVAKYRASQTSPLAGKLAELDAYFAAVT